MRSMHVRNRKTLHVFAARVSLALRAPTAKRGASKRRCGVGRPAYTTEDRSIVPEN